MIASGSPPAFFTLSAQVFSSGSAGFLPLGKLRVRDRVDLVCAVGLELLDALVLEIGPGARHLAGPLVGAVIVDHLLLRGRHLAVHRLVEHEREGGGVERHLHVVLGDLVDAEQRHRAPREGHGFGNALLENVAHLRRARLHIGAAEQRDERGHRGVRRPDLHALDVAGHGDLLRLGVERAGIVHEGEAELDVLHLLLGVLAVPVIERLRAALGVRDEEWQFAGADDREAAGLIAGIDVGEVGDAVARHVVMVERLAELLRGIDLVLDGAARGLLDRGTPVFQRLLQRMRRRHPVRELELEGLVLRGGHAGRKAEGRAERDDLSSHDSSLLWLVAVGRTLASTARVRQLPKCQRRVGNIPANPACVPEAHRLCAERSRGRRINERAPDHRSRTAAGADRLRAAPRPACRVPGFLRGVRAVRHPPGAVFRADHHRAQSGTDPDPGRRGARHQAHQLRRHARRAGEARPRRAAAGARQALLCALSHDRRRRADAQAQARDQGAREPHDRARRRGRARPAGRAAAGDRGRACARQLKNGKASRALRPGSAET